MGDQAPGSRGLQVGVAGQFFGAFLGVGFAVEVGGGGIEEPGEALGGAACGDQRVGVGVEEAGGSGAGPGGIEFRGLQSNYSLIVLAEVHAGTGDHDAKFGGLVTTQGAGLVATTKFDGAFGAAEAAFAIRHDSEQAGTAGHPAGRTQFGKGFGPFARVVSGDARSFADYSNATSALTRRPCVCQGKTRVVVDESGRHHKMPRHSFRVALVQAQ